ncbi:MAG: hypothetical protein B6D39_00835 [Anaerolineae bacterium UTCFX2]|nr:MAG: hypothetical protein B6D39_00835 [Anaerolineae bacterium UTCFX2]
MSTGGMAEEGSGNGMAKSKIEIITDSTCDIPDDLIERYGIRVLPQIVIWGDQQYLDRVTIQPEEFYQRLQTDPVRPTTAQVLEQDFLTAYQEAENQGAQAALVVTIGAALSGTYQNARLAGGKARLPVTVVDSKGPTMSLGWQVLAAARLIEEGFDVPAVVDRLAEIRKQLVQIVGMDTIDYLQRGGRIGNAAKWVGALLQVRPVVEINHASGVVEPAGLARTHSKMIELVYQKFFEKIDLKGRLHIAVMHGNAPDEAQQLAQRIRQEHNPAELLINITGVVLGINTGPNALALCGYAE